MARLLLQADVVFTPHRRINDGWLVIEHGRIVEMGSGRRPAIEKTIRAEIVAPGFVDLQVNGFKGKSCQEGIDAIRYIAAELVTTGVTAFTPTAVTSPFSSMMQFVHECNACMNERVGAKVLGAHMEGPFINPIRKGAHDESYIVKPTFEQINEVIKAKPSIITLAPEVFEDKSYIKILTNSGVVVSLGHTDATYEEAREAIEQGARLGTHIFNAMKPLTHREPGIIGALLDSDITVGLIADGLHLHPSIVRLIYKLKGPDQIVLISDQTSATLMPAGRYKLGNYEVLKDESSVRLSDGTLAGSVATFTDMIRFLANVVCLPFCDILVMASKTPASLMGLNTGDIAEGEVADIVMLNHDFTVAATIIDGNMQYQASAS